MRKVLALTACLAVVAAALFFQSRRSSAQFAFQDEVLRRKEAAASSKPRKSQSVEPGVEELKADARSRKTARPAPEAAQSETTHSDADVLSQSSKLRRRKFAQQADAGRSLEVARAFDSLHEKALAAGAVRVIVRLRAEFEPEGTLPGATAVFAQRRGISSSQDAVLALVPAASRRFVKRFETVPYVALEVDAAGVEALRASPEVAGVEEDVPVPATLAESVALIGAPAAWAAGFSGSGQAVAVLDTGVDKSHSFLSGKVVSEACFSTTSGANNSNSVCPGGVAESTASGSGVNCLVGGCDHGTHVAGIVAGKGASSSGVAKDASVIAVQVFSRFNNASDCQGSPPCVRSFGSDQMKGLERVFALRSTFNIASINMSLGGGQNASNCDGNSLKPIIDNLRSAGIATVIASGNDGFTSAISSPACISSAVSVGSTNDGSGSDAADTISSFSNSASILSLLAPGSSIRSSVPGGGFANFQGTSMATPHVAGAWAVLKSRSPSATVTQVLNALKDTGQPITDGRNGITKPRIRVDAAVNALGGGGGGGGCGPPAPIGIGQTVNGSLAATDCRFPAGGDRFSDAYTFAGAAGQQITVSMSSGAFDTFVHLLGPGGAEVASDDDGGGGTNSRIPASSGFFTLPSSGTYTIQATSFSAATSGTYTLGLTAQTADNCAAVTPISFGQTLGGSLSGTDCRLADNSSFDKYSFSGTAGQQVSISMSSSAFDTFLILLKPDGSPLASDDDGGGGTNSRIPASSGTITLPTTGTYIVYANSFSAGVTGAYSLTLTGQTPGGSCPSSGISLGQTVGGTLSGSDCQLSDGSLFDSYTFSGTAGQQISVSMSSPTFDTYLLLLRPDNTLLAEDDDGGGGTNSRMPASSGTITLPATGTYRILANSFSAGVTGGYTLTLSGTSPVSCASAAISAGQTVSGALANTDCRLADNSFFDSYSFTGTAGQQVAVSMNSFAFDTYLFLTGPNGLVVDDDDGGGSTNSRIPPGTGFFTLPTSGTYNILANSFSSNTTGTYTLSLVTSQAGCSYNLGSPGALFVFGGGAGSVGVVAGAGCGWSAVSNAPWITVTSGANGTANGVVNFSVAPNNTPDPRTGTLTIAGRTFAVDQATNAANTVQLGAASFGVNESARKVLVNVTRTGNTSAFATVAYATSDGTADRHKDYTQTLGTLDFAPGETTKTVTVFVTDDALQEAAETFSFTLSSASGTTIGTPASAVVTVTSNDATTGPNPVDAASFNAPFYVGQHYVDFLNREADAPGLAFWTNEITSCGANQQCAEVKRVNVSAAFFLSIEFQNTGYLVYLFYKSAYGDATSPNVAGTVPVVRLEEFLPDTQRIGRSLIVGQPGWEAQLEANKQAFALGFVSRPRFTAAFPPAMTPAQFVDKLRQNTGAALTPAETAALAAQLTADNTQSGRAAVLRAVAEDGDLRQAERNRAFVLMQYYGYLRRNPNDAPEPTLNFAGWKFWLDKLNQFNGNFVQAEMVKAFINSTEYRQRFGN
ncbi:MAG TPA: S8 family serine peptidase [Pyrinomonadaceae bacterium]|nr:S8 family serine peptidase [Pyrinomonadaceae bacterium]